MDAIYRYFKEAVDSIQEFVIGTIGVVDGRGIVVACSDKSLIAKKFKYYEEILLEDKNAGSVSEHYFKKVLESNEIEYVTFISKENTNCEQILNLFTANILHLKRLFNQKYDKVSFIKDVVLENISLEEIYLRIDKLGIDNCVKRVVYVIISNELINTALYTKISSVVGNKDFVLLIDDNVLVLVLEVFKENFVSEFSENLVDMLKKYKLKNYSIGLSGSLRGVNNIGTAYKQARIAIEAGKIFDDKSYILSYNDLGVVRIISNLPKDLCNLYLDEIFKEKIDEVLDGEMLLTVERFFGNSLNLSQTSRELYVHRNTMTHRLDKINELIGLDIRNFDDALKLKIGMMIKRYLDSKMDTF